MLTYKAPRHRQMIKDMRVGYRSCTGLLLAPNNILLATQKFLLERRCNVGSRLSHLTSCGLLHLLANACLPYMDMMSVEFKYTSGMRPPKQEYEVARREGVSLAIKSACLVVVDQLRRAAVMVCPCTCIYECFGHLLPHLIYLSIKLKIKQKKKKMSLTAEIPSKHSIGEYAFKNKQCTPPGD
jgi:hypothetical protein